jgi:hypothetical protein
MTQMVLLEGNNWHKTPQNPRLSFLVVDFTATADGVCMTSALSVGGGGMCKGYKLRPQQCWPASTANMDDATLQAVSLYSFRVHGNWQ